MKNLKALVAEPKAEATAPDVALTRNDRPRRERPDRVGQRLLAGHVDGETFKSFKILCAEEGATTQAMISEAVQLLFTKYKKPINDQLSTQAAERS